MVLEGEALDLSRVPLEGEDWNIDDEDRCSADLTLDARTSRYQKDVQPAIVTGLVAGQAIGIDSTCILLEQSSTSSWGRTRRDQSRRIISDLISVEMDGNITWRQWDRWRMKVDAR